jgi:hypothetical protein
MMRKTYWLPCILAAGCMMKTYPQAADAPPDEAAVLADVAHGAFRTSTDFAEVNAQEYTSSLAATSKINVWVNKIGFADYSGIEPEVSNSHHTVAPGPVIVREVFDMTGAVTKLTLMVKGPAGYNPTVGDFWFGVTNPDGTPMMDNGGQQMGKLTTCFACHQARASDGFLFGVPGAMRHGAAADGGAPPDDAGPHVADDAGEPVDMAGMGGGCKHHHCDGGQQ